MATAFTGRIARLGPNVLIVPSLSVIFALQGRMFGGWPGAAVGGVAGLCWALVLGRFGPWLRRRDGRGVASNVVLAFAIVAASYVVFGGGAWRTVTGATLQHAPAFVSVLLSQPIGGNIVTQFIVANVSLELAFMALALLLNWEHPQRRPWVILAAALFYAMRVWSYAYFVPIMLDLTARGAAGLTPADLDLFRHWLRIDLRIWLDVAVFGCLLIAALVPLDRLRSAPAHG